MSKNRELALNIAVERAADTDRVLDVLAAADRILTWLEDKPDTRPNGAAKTPGNAWKSIGYFVDPGPMLSADAIWNALRLTEPVQRDKDGADVDFGKYRYFRSNLTGLLRRAPKYAGRNSGVDFWDRDKKRWATSLLELWRVSTDPFTSEVKHV